MFLPLAQTLREPQAVFRALLRIMTGNKDQQSRSPEVLQDRIAELEKELALLRARETGPASKKRRRNERDGSQPREILWELWLVDTIKNLFEFSTEGAIDHTLTELSELLQMDGCCFHLMSPDRTPIRLHSHWRNNSFNNTNTINNTTITAPWEQIPATDNSIWLSQIQQAEPLTILQSSFNTLPRTIQRALHNSNIHSFTVLPIQRRSSIDGYLCLFKQQTNPRLSWSERELKLALAIGEVADMVIERQAMAARLAARDTRFQYAIEASRDGLWDWDLNTGEIYFSHSFLRMLGHEDSLLEMNYTTLQERFIHPEDLQYVRSHYQRAIDEKLDHVDFEYRMLHKDGSALWIYSRTKFVERDRSGKPQRAVGINADITHFKKSQEELLNAKTQADSANRTKSEFLNRMSHEIRTPMNAIIGMGHLLRDTAINRKQTDYLSNIDQAAHSLLHIIDKILDFAKIDSDKIVLDNIHFDLDEVLENLAQTTDTDASNKKLDVIFDSDSKTPRFLRGDAVRLNQILYHLINNAIKFSDRGEIIIKVRPKHSAKDFIELEFSVADQGIGMTQAEVDNLFTPFTQADGSSTRRFGGTGLGLTICRHLVQLMKGNICIDTQPGQGSKISFTARFEHSHIGSASITTQSRQFEGLRTLIVDDNDIARTVISRTTQSLHLRSDTACSAADAVNKIEAAERDQNDPYRLVLMDWRMPDINGLEASAMIKADTVIKQHPAVVMVSAYRKEEVLDRSNQSNIDGFLNKPVSQSRLFNTLAEIFSEQENEPIQATHSPLECSEIDQLLSGRHLLLAEDNIVNQKVAAGMLKKKNVRLSIANNGREAIELMQQHNGQFDAILMDIEMPEVDGFEATRTIRNSSHYPQIPIIALTAQALKGDRERCLNAGMNGYISKPVAPHKLYDTLAKLLKQEQQL